MVRRPLGGLLLLVVALAAPRAADASAGLIPEYWYLIGSCGAGGSECGWDCTPPEVDEDTTLCPAGPACGIYGSDALRVRIQVSLDDSHCDGQDGSSMTVRIVGSQRGGTPFSLAKEIDFCGVTCSTGGECLEQCEEPVGCPDRGVVYLCNPATGAVDELSLIEEPFAWEQRLQPLVFFRDELAALGFPDEIPVLTGSLIEITQYGFDDDALDTVAEGCGVIEYVSDRCIGGPNFHAFCTDDSECPESECGTPAIPDLTGRVTSADVVDPPQLEPCTPLCGDGTLHPGEECDDANTASEDGCSAACAVESCGDGVVQGGLGETCEDGKTEDEDGCSGACQSEFCGDGVVQGGLGEQCDDGNTADGDACPGTCRFSPIVCGDGVQEGEEGCDDGNTVPGDGCGAACQVEPEPPAPLTRAELDCVDKTNRAVTKLAGSFGKEALRCVKDASRGRVADVGTCLLAPKPRVQKQEARLTATRDKKCAPADLPTFAFVDDADAVARAARDRALALVPTLYGDPPDAAVAEKASSPLGARCQQEVHERAEKLFDTLLREYVKAKKQALRDTNARPAVRSGAELAGVLQSVSSSSAKVEKAARQLAEKPLRKCAGADFTALFPGDCAAADLASVLECATRRVACESCLLLNDADGLAIECDLVDDGLSNASCA